MSIRKIILIVLFSILCVISGLLAEEKSHVGIVKDIEKADNYSYLQIDEDSKDVWLATPSFNVSVKDKVEYSVEIVMKDFHSKVLNKTFASIFFVSQIRVLNGDTPKNEQVPKNDDYRKNIPQKQDTVSIPKSGEIAKAEKGKTIKEIFSEREQLKGKEVILRAKVIKVSQNILNKNWITLHDGTGVSPDDRLVATTSEDVDIGDILIVKGIAKTDVDIGAGYKYKVLLENTKFTK